MGGGDYCRVVVVVVVAMGWVGCCDSSGGRGGYLNSGCRVLVVIVAVVLGVGVLVEIVVVGLIFVVHNSVGRMVVVIAV